MISKVKRSHQRSMDVKKRSTLKKMPTRTQFLAWILIWYPWPAQTVDIWPQKSFEVTRGHWRSNRGQKEVKLQKCPQGPNFGKLSVDIPDPHRIWHFGQRSRLKIKCYQKSKIKVSWNVYHLLYLNLLGFSLPKWYNNI